MRFYFDIDDYEFKDECGVDFKQTVMNAAIDSLARWIYGEATNPDGWYSEVDKQIKNIIKSHQNEIVESVVERVSDKIAKKKTIMEMTPKVSELAVLDKDNALYFEQMIDKVIAKKFGK